MTLSPVQKLKQPFLKSKGKTGKEKQRSFLLTMQTWTSYLTSIGLVVPMYKWG